MHLTQILLCFAAGRSSIFAFALPAGVASNSQVEGHDTSLVKTPVEPAGDQNGALLISPPERIDTNSRSGRGDHSFERAMELAPVFKINRMFRETISRATDRSKERIAEIFEWVERTKDRKAYSSLTKKLINNRKVDFTKREYRLYVALFESDTEGDDDNHQYSRGEMILETPKLASETAGYKASKKLVVEMAKRIDDVHGEDTDSRMTEEKLEGWGKNDLDRLHRGLTKYYAKIEPQYLSRENSDTLTYHSVMAAAIREFDQSDDLGRLTFGSNADTKANSGEKSTRPGPQSKEAETLIEMVRELLDDEDSTDDKDAVSLRTILGLGPPTRSTTFKRSAPPERQHNVPTFSSPIIRRDSIVSVAQISQSSEQSARQQAKEQIQTYLLAYQAVQGEVGRRIMPFIQTVVNASSSPLVRQVAWSVYSDMTATSPFVAGPFSHGLNCIGWLEAQLFNATAVERLGLGPTDGKVFKEYKRQVMVSNSVLLSLYNYMWYNGSAAVNHDGLLDNMATLRTYLQPEDPSILPEGWSSRIEKSYDTSFFQTSGAV